MSARRPQRGSSGSARTATSRPEAEQAAKSPERFLGIAEAAVIAAATAASIWVMYYPSDSTEVEAGDALGFCLAAMLIVAAGVAIRIWKSRWAQNSLNAKSSEVPDRDIANLSLTDWRLSLLIDALAVGLACWVFLSAYVSAGWFPWTSPLTLETPSGSVELGGNLRAATNEAWLWIAGAGWFVMSRRWLARREVAHAVIGLLLVYVAVLAIHALHQTYISLPQTLADFLRDPDEAIAHIGLDAPPGSAARMILENRLRDGGPTATFALANSLAGVLAIGTTLVFALIVEQLRSQFQLGQSTHVVGVFKRNWLFIAASLGTFVLMATALWATRSRSALLAVLIACGLYGAWEVLCYFRRKSRRPHCRNPSESGGDTNGRKPSRPKRRVILASILGGTAIAVASVVFVAGRSAVLGDEMISQAPASVAFRLQYWQATMSMVRDAPWFGVGPGNFQMVYQRYRDFRAHESIAEPHSFLFETLASGGVVAALLLVTGLLSGFVWFWRQNGLVKVINPDEQDVFQPSRSGRSFRDPAKWAIPIGTFAGFALVWTWGVAMGMMPDFEAHHWAVLIGAVVGVWWWSQSSLSFRSYRVASCFSLVAGLIHLSFSGGLTVPGVSILLCWLAGLVVAKQDSSGQVSMKDDQAFRRSTHHWSFRTSILSLAVWLSFAALLVIASYLPVRRCNALITEATVLMARGRTTQAVPVLEQAMVADPLASEPAIWRLQIANRDVLPQQLNERSEWKETSNPARDGMTDASGLEQLFEETRQRVGNDPSRLLVLSEMLLHRYQVSGGTLDLQKATEILFECVQRSPTQQTMVAQMAEVTREWASIRKRDRLVSPQETEVANHRLEGRHEIRGLRLLARDWPRGPNEPPTTEQEASKQMTASWLAKRAAWLAESGGVVTRSLALQPILRVQTFGRVAIPEPVREPADRILARILP